MSDSVDAQGGRAWVTPSEFTPRRLPLGSLAPPTSPSVHLWYLDPGRLWQSLSSALGHSDGEMSNQGEMTARQLRFARRFYLRMLLGAYLGLPGKEVALIRKGRGKPMLDVSRHGTGLHFSLAKSGGRLLIGISGSAEVGVDLEREYRKPRDATVLAARFFTGTEAAAIGEAEASQRDAAFMRTWACKEAVAKASGHGIANRFCRFSVNAPASGPPLVVEDQDLPAENWRLALTVPEPGYIAAVAVQQPSLRVKGYRI